MSSPNKEVEVEEVSPDTSKLKENIETEEIVPDGRCFAEAFAHTDLCCRRDSCSFCYRRFGVVDLFAAI